MVQTFTDPFALALSQFTREAETAGEALRVFAARMEAGNQQLALVVTEWTMRASLGTLPITSDEWLVAAWTILIHKRHQPDGWYQWRNGVSLARYCIGRAYRAHLKDMGWQE